jgi:hypothetical protein
VPLHLVCRLPADRNRKTRFMLQDMEVNWYSNPLERIGAIFRIARRYRRRVLTPPFNLRSIIIARASLSLFARPAACLLALNVSNCSCDPSDDRETVHADGRHTRRSPLPPPSHSDSSSAWLDRRRAGREPQRQQRRHQETPSDLRESNHRCLPDR